MGRDITFDIAKGIAIILMIVGHCFPESPVIIKFIFSFHMPFFFLVSGFFYRPKKFSDCLKKDMRHLMVPYFATCAAILVFYLLFWMKTGDGSKFEYCLQATFWGSGAPHTTALFADVPYIGAIWFFPALLICKNVYNVIPGNKFVWAIILFVVSTILGRYVIYLPFSFFSGLSAIVFYAIGDKLKEVKSIKWPYWVLGIVCWGISLLISHVDAVEPRYDLYFIDVIGATTASILLFFFSKFISGMSAISKVMSWIGEKTMYILCFHLIDWYYGLYSRLNFIHEGYFAFVLRILVPIFLAWAYCLVQAEVKKRFAGTV